MRWTGQNVLHWNQRVSSSLKSGDVYCPDGRKNPAVSVVHYGWPVSEKFSPAGIWRRRVSSRH